MATFAPIKLRRGDTFEFPFDWLNSGVLVDLSDGWSGRMQLRTSPDSTNVLAEAVFTFTGTSGLATISRSATAALPAGTLVYDLELSKGSVTATLFEGPAVVTPDVSR
jgi:hypothetical protein